MIHEGPVHINIRTGAVSWPAAFSAAKRQQKSRGTGVSYSVIHNSTVNVNHRLYYEPIYYDEIMRHGIAVLVPVIIVMILIAGCTSAQNGSSTGTKSQNSVPGSPSPGRTSFVFSLPEHWTCRDYSKDINRFRKFFPDMTGWSRTIKNRYDYFFNGTNRVREQYMKNDDDKKTIVIIIEDLSLCSYDANDDLNLIKTVSDPRSVSITSNIRYHGYPAMRVECETCGNFFYSNYTEYFVITPQILVTMYPVSAKEMSKPEIEAYFEEFANAMDFNGMSMMENTVSRPTATTNPTRFIQVTAQYNPQNGMITVTNKGGSHAGDLSFITVSVNEASFPVKLGPDAGSVITVRGIPGAKNHVTAIATFRDGMQQMVLDMVVG